MKKQKSRLSKVIENDRLVINADMTSLIVYDLKKLLDNYFDVTGEIDLIVNATEREYQVKISLNASAIKTFGLIKQ